MKKLKSDYATAKKDTTTCKRNLNHRQLQVKKLQSEKIALETKLTTSNAELAKSKQKLVNQIKQQQSTISKLKSQKSAAETQTLTCNNILKQLKSDKESMTNQSAAC